MLNRFCKFLPLFLLTGCLSLNSKHAITVPAIDYRIDQSTLKTTGYYYCEKTRESYCRSVPYASGYKYDESSKYDQKYISAFILDADGYCYATGGLITSGINSSAMNHCNEIYTHNTYSHARKKFEEFISWFTPLRNDGKQDRGVFNITGDTIRFQVYESGSPTLSLLEYEAVIINDTAFHVISEGRYKGKRYPLDDFYHFKSLAAKPDSMNYIRDHRDKFDKPKEKR